MMMIRKEYAYSNNIQDNREQHTVETPALPHAKWEGAHCAFEVNRISGDSVFMTSEKVDSNEHSFFWKSAAAKDLSPAEYSRTL